MGAFEELVAGSFFDSIVTTFTNLGFSSELFYLIVWATITGLVVMKTRSWALGIMMMMATAFAVVPSIMPQAQKFIIVFIIGGFAFIMYQIFKPRG